MRRAVFLDKDGTLVEDVPYNVDPRRIMIRAGARDALERLRRVGYALVVVTNQPGIALRRYEAPALAGVHQHLKRAGLPLDDFYYCPHHPQDGCGCRKPRAGLLQRAAADLALDLRNSWMVGDILDDVEAGKRAGCRTVLLDVGSETEWQAGPLRVPDVIAGSLQHACDEILRHDAAARSAS